MSDSQDESGSPRTRIKLGAAFDSLVDAEGPKWSVIIGPPAAALDLGAIEARANAATPGPWELCDDGYGSQEIAGPEGERMVCFASQDAVCWERDADHVFVIAAREDVPALVARMRKLEEAARDVVSGCADTANVRALDALAALVGGDR